MNLPHIYLKYNHYNINLAHDQIVLAMNPVQSSAGADFSIGRDEIPRSAGKESRIFQAAPETEIASLRSQLHPLAPVTEGIQASRNMG